MTVKSSEQVLGELRADQRPEAHRVLGWFEQPARQQLAGHSQVAEVDLTVGRTRIDAALQDPTQPIRWSSVTGRINGSHRNMEERIPFRNFMVQANMMDAELYYMTRYLHGSRDQAEQKQKPVVLVDAPSHSMLVRMQLPLVEFGDNPEAQLAVEAEELLGYTPLAEHVGVQSQLRRVLAALEIEVLDQDSVDRYKAQMVEHYDSYQKMEQPTWRLHKLEDYALEVPKFVLRKAVAIKKALPGALFYIDQLAVDPFLIVSMEQLPDHWSNLPSRELDLDDAAYIEVWNEPGFEVTL